MPAHKTPKPLRDLCIKSLITSAIKCPADLTTVTLPPSLSTDLIRVAYAEQLKGRVTTLQYSDLVRLFSATLTELTLEMVDQYCGESSVTLHETTRRLLRKIAEKTNPAFFRSLTIYGHWLPWKECDLSRTISCVVGLNQLTLFVRGLTDVIIKAIAISCRDLEELRLQGIEFTDCGLKSLAGYVWTSGLHEPESIGCPKLRTLIISDSEDMTPLFSSFSISAIIDHIDSLRTVLLPNDRLVTDAITRLIDIEPNRKLPLISLKCRPDFIKDTFVNLPQLTNLSLLVNYDYDFKKLAPLATLDHLHTLILNEDTQYDYEGDYLSYRSRSNESLYDFLLVVGSKLTVLELHLELIFDIGILGQYCPHLTLFEMTNVVAISDDRARQRCQQPARSYSSDYFPHLTTLKLLANSDNKIKESDLIRLLSNCPQVEFLFIGWCETFSDHVIYESMSTISNLKQLELHEMSSALTKDGICQLALNLDKIRFINLLGCEDISSFDVMEISAIIDSMNLDCKIKHQSW